MCCQVRAEAAKLLAVQHETEGEEVWVEVGGEWFEIEEQQVLAGKKWVEVQGKVVGMRGDGVQSHKNIVTHNSDCFVLATSGNCISDIAFAAVFLVNYQYH